VPVATSGKRFGGVRRDPQNLRQPYTQGMRGVTTSTEDDAAAPRGGRRPIPVVAAVLSLAAPGAGQWYAGARRRGIWILIGWTVAAAPVVAVGIAVGGSPGVLRDLVGPLLDSPDLAILLVAAQAAVAGLQAWAASDAWLIARRDRRGDPALWRRLIVAGTVVAMAALLVVPHRWVAERTLAVHELLTFDFSVHRSAVVGGDGIPPTSLEATTTTSEPRVEVPMTTTSSSSTTTFAPPEPGSITTTTTMPIPSTTSTIPPFVGVWYTVALLGADSGPGRWGVRTDSIIVASFEQTSGRAALFSVPRNWQRAPLPEGHPAADSECNCYRRDILNALYQFGLVNPDLFPDAANPGAASLLPSLELILGIPIDDYALIDLQGFERAIDVLGGIEIYVPVSVHDDGHVYPNGDVDDLDIWRGWQWMSGRRALAYARARHETSDYHRMDRQRCVLKAVADQLDPITVVNSLPDLVNILTDSLVTGIPVDEWPDIIDRLDLVDTGAVVAVSFTPSAPELTGTGETYTGNVELVRETVRTALERPLDEALSTIGVETLDGVCS